MSMFCFQCEQTFRQTGCVTGGVCGKDPVSATLQDVLLHVCEGISMYAHRARANGGVDPEVDSFVLEALFATVTNVNFDPARIMALIHQGTALRQRTQALYEQSAKAQGKTAASLSGPAAFQPADNERELLAQGEAIGLLARKQRTAEVELSLQELLTYGVKGLAAYAYHAEVLGQKDEQIYGFVHEALDALTEERSVEELLALCLKAGQVNLTAMELLDRANTEAYGHPEPTPVRVTPVAGKAICVSGHDLKDLEELLKQTAGTGIKVYTHGEMLPAHGYPKLKAYPHLVGNYGGAWFEQQKEFAAFPGAILMTTNCIQRPAASYRDRIFTAGPVAWPEVQHIKERDFSPLIAAALAAPGFTADAEQKTILVGFGRQAVLGVADQIIAAVKEGAIKHFFLIGGCDGSSPSRYSFTQLAQSVPQDCLILTLACGKYRFNKLDFGEIRGIPRLLDIGQCNDAYSAIQIASALAQAFDTDVNSLPLSLILSWYEQKAVAILLTLLHLGIRNIRLGPTMPAFLSTAVREVLSSTFNLMPISSPEADLAAIMGATAA